jgi:hypothetical protein
VCCVSFDRGVILCDVCYLFVVSYCKSMPPGKNPFAVNKYYITNYQIKLQFLWAIYSPKNHRELVKIRLFHLPNRLSFSV